MIGAQCNRGLARRGPVRSGFRARRGPVQSGPGETRPGALGVPSDRGPVQLPEHPPAQKMWTPRLQIEIAVDILRSCVCAWALEACGFVCACACAFVFVFVCPLCSFFLSLSICLPSLPFMLSLSLFSSYNISNSRLGQHVENNISNCWDNTVLHNVWDNTAG